MVAVVDKHTSRSVFNELKNTNINMVSSEWVIQCLIAGTALPTDGHPRYAVETREATPEETF